MKRVMALLAAGTVVAGICAYSATGQTAKSDGKRGTRASTASEQNVSGETRE